VFADIAGVEAQAVDTPFKHPQGKLVIKMDIRNDRDLALRLDGREGVGGIGIRHRAADDFTTGRSQGTYLVKCGIDITGIGGTHGLNGAGSAPSHCHRADMELSGWSFHSSRIVAEALFNCNRRLGQFLFRSES